ncbi:MAG: alpha/beta hydrolase [Myxococcota bacterium]
MPKARLHDGNLLELEVGGDGDPLLLPVNPRPVEGEKAEAMRKYGADPALGRSLIDGLRDICRVIAFDYEGHVLKTPKPTTLTPDNVVADFLSVADAAGATTFRYYGYSWLGMMGLQLAVRTPRLTGVAVGGYPPLDGPYAEMLRVTTAAYDMTGKPSHDEWSMESRSKGEAQQFVTLYRALQGFDDRAALERVKIPRVCFVGSADEIDYGKNWGDVRVSIGGPVVRHRQELQRLGWDVHILDGMNHMQAMQANVVLPILRDWLARRPLVGSAR